MPNQADVENAVKTLVLECCPEHVQPIGGPHAFSAAPSATGLPWSQILVVVKTLLPVILDLLTNLKRPAPKEM